ncbi:MAG TPA: cation diffusion facilitator family transporter [Candidatus Kryptonia bacterium]
MPDRNPLERPLLYSIILNACIFVTELAGGLLSNSLALVSDAMHNFSDLVALTISFAAARMMKWSGNERKSYGYFRVEILAALINSVILVLIGVYIIYEGVARISEPPRIRAALMFVVATVGFGGNIISVFLLRPHRDESLNAKSAFLHLSTDAVESAAVILTAVLISFFKIQIFDALISVAIGILIIKSSWDLLLESVNILTEGSPKGIDLNEVADLIRRYPGVIGVHHLHIWSLSTKFRALSAHIVVQDMPISRTTGITNGIETELRSKFSIDHPTFQLEAIACEDDLISQYRDRTHPASSDSQT